MDLHLNSDALRWVAGLGGWAVITSGLAAWIARVVAARLSARWAAAQQVTLEHLRADIGRNQMMLTTAIGAFSASQSAANERRFVAIEELWRAVLRLRERTPPIVPLLDILLPTEHSELFTNRNLIAARQQVTDQSIADLSVYSTGNLESFRPFLGEYLWSLFFAYRALVLRIAFLLTNTKDPQSYRPWYQDAGIGQLLGSVFSKEELQALMANKFGRFESIRGAIERKMLEHANRVVSGEVAGDLGLTQAARIRDAALQIARNDA